MVCAPVRRDNPRALGAQTMLYLTCTTITSVDLAHYGVSRAKDWVSVDCGTINIDTSLIVYNSAQSFFLASGHFSHVATWRIRRTCRKKPNASGPVLRYCS